MYCVLTDRTVIEPLGGNQQRRRVKTASNFEGKLGCYFLLIASDQGKHHSGGGVL
jgi:hypothetical protein